MDQAINEYNHDPPVPVPEDADFFNWEDPAPLGRTSQDRADWISRLEDLNTKFSEGLYISEGPSFEILDKWHLFEQDTQKPSPYSRVLDPIFTQNPLFSDDLHSLQLEIDKPLQVGRDHFGQVWLGTAGRAGSKTRSTVILKIFQESYYHRDIWMVRDNCSRISGAAQAQSEAWAYSRLKAVQGDGIFNQKQIVAHSTTQ